MAEGLGVFHHEQILANVNEKNCWYFADPKPSSVSAFLNGCKSGLEKQNFFLPDIKPIWFCFA